MYNQVPMASIDTHESWDKRGVYGLFASKRGQVLLRLVGFTVGKDGLVYVGKTGTASPSACRTTAGATAT